MATPLANQHWNDQHHTCDLCKQMMAQGFSVDVYMTCRGSLVIYPCRYFIASDNDMHVVQRGILTIQEKLQLLDYFT